MKLDPAKGATIQTGQHRGKAELKLNLVFALAARCRLVQSFSIGKYSLSFYRLLYAAIFTERRLAEKD